MWGHVMIMINFNEKICFFLVGTQMAYETSRLTAFSTAQTHSTTLHKVGGVNAFVAMTDYVYVISANDPYQIVTVEVRYHKAFVSPS